MAMVHIEHRVPLGFPLLLLYVHTQSAATFNF